LKLSKQALSGGGVAYIREIARNLYELKNRLEELEQAYNAEPPGERRDELQLELNRTQQEHKRLKSILEGAKESS
jgi:hypothetical protein